ncbi:CorA family divalent cation transporter [Chakrabartyella piscis]|uniref:CorA family divalent cation transporter n=1 Tax=Chakrabartyella piscis TaxID=2918914 RepID=UPI002958998B|nr:CorA family divalent cation transporter [Chakrabartyella piscis]
MHLPETVKIIHLDRNEIIYICPFTTMTEMEKLFDIGIEILEEGKRFGYLCCDVYEGFLCLGMEQLHVSDVLKSKNRMVAYWEQTRFIVFTTHIDPVLECMEQLVVKLGERVSLLRVIHGFLEFLTKEDEVLLDGIEGEILALEQHLIMVQDGDCVEEIVDLRKRLLVLKRYYEQTVLLLEGILEDENEWLDEKSKSLFRLLRKRTERKLQNILYLRESVTQVRETYEAEVEINLNQTMKRFTGLTSIFFPLTLIVGWYGMNFAIPEYDWRLGYVFVIGISIAITVLGIIYFRRKKWF